MVLGYPTRDLFKTCIKEILFVCTFIFTTTTTTPHELKLRCVHTHYIYNTQLALGLKHSTTPLRWSNKMSSLTKKKKKKKKETFSIVWAPILYPPTPKKRPGRTQNCIWWWGSYSRALGVWNTYSLLLLPGSPIVSVRVFNVWKLFVSNRNTWYLITMGKLFVLIDISSYKY